MDNAVRGPPMAPVLSHESRDSRMMAASNVCKEEASVRRPNQLAMLGIPERVHRLKLNRESIKTEKDLKLL